PISYARTNWAALERYTAAGFLTIDNNRSERCLRQVAVGRNNWGVAGSEAGGRTAAVLYSVVVRPESLCLQWGNGHDARYPDRPNRRVVSRWGAADRGWSR